MIRIFSIINTSDEIPVAFSTGATELSRGQVSSNGVKQIISGDFENPNITAMQNAGLSILTEEEARLQACAWDAV